MSWTNTNDYLVAAIAVAENYTLVTGNAREFGKVPGLPIENWLKPAQK
jgi:tRNA(fMet)-specific endonuclease VapC